VRTNILSAEECERSGDCFNLLRRFKRHAKIHPLLLNMLLHDSKIDIRNDSELLESLIDASVIQTVLAGNPDAIDDSIVMELLGNGTLPRIMSNPDFESMLRAALTDPKFGDIAEHLASTIADCSPEAFLAAVCKHPEKERLVQGMMDADSSLLEKIIRMNSPKEEGGANIVLQFIVDNFEHEMAGLMVESAYETTLEKILEADPHSALLMMQKQHPYLLAENFNNLDDGKIIQSAFTKGPAGVIDQVSHLLDYNDSAMNALIAKNPGLFEGLGKLLKGNDIALTALHKTFSLGDEICRTQEGLQKFLRDNADAVGCALASDPTGLQSVLRATAEAPKNFPKCWEKQEKVGDDAAVADADADADPEAEAADSTVEGGDVEEGDGEGNDADPVDEGPPPPTPEEQAAIDRSTILFNAIAEFDKIADGEKYGAHMIEDELIPIFNDDPQGLGETLAHIGALAVNPQNPVGMSIADSIAADPKGFMACMKMDTENKDKWLKLQAEIIANVSHHDLVDMLVNSGEIDGLIDEEEARGLVNQGGGGVAIDPNSTRHSDDRRGYSEEAKFTVPDAWARCLAQDSKKKPTEELLPMTQRQLKQVIYELYEQKLKSDKQSERDHIPNQTPMHVVMSYYYKIYGKLFLVQQRLESLLIAMQQYQDEPWIGLWCRFCGCGNHLNAEALKTFLVAFDKACKAANSPDKHTEQQKNRDNPIYDLPRLELKKAKIMMASLTRQMMVDASNQKNLVKQLNTNAFEGTMPPNIQTECITVDNFMLTFIAVVADAVAAKRRIANAMFTELDESGDGTLTFDEFIDIAAKFDTFKGLSTQSTRQIFVHAITRYPSDDGGLSREAFLDLCQTQLRRSMQKHIESAAATEGASSLIMTHGIKKSFDHFDVNDDNSLGHDELQKLLTELGEPACPIDIQLKFRLLDIDQDGGIDFNEFVTYYRELAIKRIFKTIDVDGVGEIQIKHGTEAFLTDLGVDTHNEACKRLLSDHPLDRDGDGGVSFGEFYDWWTQFDLHSIFNKYDDDFSSSLNKEELVFMCHDLGLRLTPEQIEGEFVELEGLVFGLTFSEFFAWWTAFHHKAMENKLKNRLAQKGEVNELTGRLIAKKERQYMLEMDAQREDMVRAKQEKDKLLTKVAAEYQLDLDDVLNKFATPASA